MKKIKKVYLCNTDWDWEVGEEMLNPNVVVYPSIESLKNHKKCWKECGIIEIKMTEVKIIESGDLFSDTLKGD